jgi:hypothetical protein
MARKSSEKRNLRKLWCCRTYKIRFMLEMASSLAAALGNVVMANLRYGSRISSGASS